jgi:DNA-binding GntR family transcriptional regulator
MQNQRLKIYEELKQRIILGRYKQNSILSEKEICEEFAVSRTPYREALIQLEIEGLLIIKPKVGVVISPINLQSLSDVFEMRTILEGVAAQLAFKRIQPYHLKTLKKIVGEIESLRPEDDIFSYLELDAQFHSIIRDAQGNQILKDSLEKLYNQCMRLWNTIENTALVENLIKLSIKDIKKVYQAFTDKNSAAVERLIKEHFNFYLKTMAMHLMRGLEDEAISR